ncbi:MAG: hypothetical protein ACLQGU_02565 [bacterium]
MLTELVSVTGGPSLFYDDNINFFQKVDGHLRAVYNVTVKDTSGKVLRIDRRTESFQKIIRPSDIDSSGSSADRRVPMTLPDGNGSIGDLKLEIMRLNGVINELGSGLGNSDQDAGALRSKLAELRRKLAVREIHANPKLRIG